jgi:hypothetical protein
MPEFLDMNPIVARHGAERLPRRINARAYCAAVVASGDYILHNSPKIAGLISSKQQLENEKIM